MTEAQLRVCISERIPALTVWGNFVADSISRDVAMALTQRGDHRTIDEFLKVPAKPRIKTIGSFLAKALHRNKAYTNPLEQITDPVGVRFVVLLSSEVELVGEIIKASHSWEVTQDKDFEKARLERPQLFDYESDHYIVRASLPRTVDGVEVQVGLPCEVQVRTLLQHAYAELSHDRLYKPECPVPESVRRLVARGSALLETTDHVFGQVSASIDQALDAIRRPHRTAMEHCVRLGICSADANPEISFRLLEQFTNVLGEMTAASFEDLLRRRDFIPNKMKSHSSESMLFSHPAGLIGYWLVDRLEDAVKHRWPFEINLLEIIAGDLGISMYGQ